MEQLADGFARVVGDVPAERLEWFMRTPLRRPLLDAIFWQMPKHLDRTRAARLTANVRWRITGSRDGDADVYDLAITKGRCRVGRGEGGTASGHDHRRRGGVHTTDHGQLRPLQAYFRGRLALAGDILLAAKLISLFRIPKGGSSRRTAPAPVT